MRKILLTLILFGMLAATSVPVVWHAPLTNVAGWEEGVTKA
jgi:hypothetical protein